MRTSRRLHDIYEYTRDELADGETARLRRRTLFLVIVSRYIFRFLSPPPSPPFLQQSSRLDDVDYLSRILRLYEMCVRKSRNLRVDIFIQRFMREQVCESLRNVISEKIGITMSFRMSSFRSAGNIYIYRAREHLRASYRATL